MRTLFTERYMQYYFAPLEGLTDSIYRHLHHKYFPGVDRYYTPFFSPTMHRTLTPRECRELPPANELDFTVVPQILTKNPEDFLWMAQKCADQGYQEVNLNLGCPSGTVTAKGKGSGMLAVPDALDAFLYHVFSKNPVAVSVKTRIGFSSPEEFPMLLQIFNRYPIKELTIHPRVRSVFYNGFVDMQAYEYAQAHSKASLCFNGNLCTAEDIAQFAHTYPGTGAVMLGRGLMADPGLFTEGGTTANALEAFYEELLDAYLEAFGGSRNAMFRLKENWRYLIRKFDGAEKLYKRLRKTTDLAEYKAITAEIFRNLPLKKDVTPDW